MKEEQSYEEFRDDLQVDFDKFINKFLKKWEKNKHFDYQVLADLMINEAKCIACITESDYFEMLGYLTDALTINLFDMFVDFKKTKKETEE